jgi:peroxiredoxin
MSKAPGAPSESLPAVDFTLKDINGKTHTLSEYKGKRIFLNFWATWCPPCRAEMPSMQKIYDSWDKKEYVMLAVNINQKKDMVKKFVDEKGYSFPVLLDPDGRVANTYRVRGIPTTYFIGEDGMIRGRLVGAHEWTLELVERLTK